MAFISGKQGDKGQNYEGNWGTKIILGNMEHKIFFFNFLGKKPVYFKGIRGQVPHLGGPQLCQGNSRINI